jgi:hypothetical protein
LLARFRPRGRFGKWDALLNRARPLSRILRDWMSDKQTAIHVAAENKLETEI